MKTFAMIGDNCIDIYEESNRSYETGNVVNTGANIIYLGYDCSILTTVGTDENSKRMKRFLKNYGFDISRVKTIEGDCAVTYMSMDGKERVHGDYIEGVMKNIDFNEDDIDYASQHKFVHSALWGNAHNVLKSIKECGRSIISFDFADRLNHELVTSLNNVVDIGFFSYDKGRDAFIEKYLIDRNNGGMKIVIATFGSKGSLAYDGKYFYEYGIFPNRVENTVGAGDSFIAGFLVGFAKGYNISKCLEQGADISSKIIGVFEPWIKKEEKL